MNKKSLILLPALMMILASCNNNSSTTTTSKGDNSSTSETSKGDSTTSEQTPIGVNYGTVESPLSVSDFSTEAAKLELADKEYSDAQFFVKGVVDTVTTYLTLAGNVRVYDYSSEEKVYVNDTVVVQGYAQCTVNNNKSYYNLAKNGDTAPTIKSLTRGESEVTSSVENGKIEGLKTTYTNGETATFTVTADDGYHVEKVVANENTLTAGEDGSYSFNVSGPSSVKVTIIKDGEVVKNWTILKEAPKTGVTYKAGVYRTADSKDYYLTGNNYTGKGDVVYDYYFEYSDDISKAADVTVEVNGDGFNIKVGSKYIVIEKSGTHTSNYFRDTASTTPWLWDADYNTFTFDVDGTKFYSGNSQNYGSISASNYQYISYTTSYPLHLYVCE